MWRGGRRDLLGQEEGLQARVQDVGASRQVEGEEDEAWRVSGQVGEQVGRTRRRGEAAARDGVREQRRVGHGGQLAVRERDVERRGVGVEGDGGIVRPALVAIAGGAREGVGRRGRLLQRRRERGVGLQRPVGVQEEAG